MWVLSVSWRIGMADRGTVMIKEKKGDVGCKSSNE